MPRKTIMLTGGGSAGHIIPTLSVARKILEKSQDFKLVYIIERKSPNEQLITDSKLPIKVHRIFAGKYRRFHNQSFLTKLFSFKNNLLNFRDLIYIVIGFFQSLGLMLRYRPSALFSKGGYVSVPVALSAVICRRKFVTHDSDSVPGLANRLVGRYAKWNAVSLPSSNFPYKSSKTVFTGVPVSEEYFTVNVKNSKTNIGLPSDSQMLFIGGGSQGARIVDDAVEKIVPELLASHHNLYVVHSFGRLNEDSLHNRYQKLDGALKKRLILKAFIPDLYNFAAAADIIITRAGATSLAGFGILAKACIVMPAGHLTGGHQIENSKVLEKQSAIVVVGEDRVGDELKKQVEYLLQHDAERLALGKKLQDVTPKDAAGKLADLVLGVAKGV